MTSSPVWDPHPDDGGPEGVRTRAFAAALRDAMSSQGVTQTDLAKRLDLRSQGTISGWINAVAEPPYETVFAIEKVLGVRPGSLSRYLGYLPVSASKVTVDVERAINEDPFLSKEAKAHLLGAYRLVKGRRTAGVARGRPPKER